MAHLHATCGLKVNLRKTFRSPTGFIFVERCFTLDPKQYSREVIIDNSVVSGDVSLWDIINTEIKRVSGKSFQFYRKLKQLIRPQLSALSLAKKQGSSSEKDVVPNWMILADVFNEQAKRADSKWRRERVNDLLRQLHSPLVKMMEGSGIPLYWPKELGGFGFEGKFKAPPSFRKAAAVILTMTTRQAKLELTKFGSLWSITGMPVRTKQTIQRVLAQVEAQEVPEPIEGRELSNEFKPRSMVQSDVITRIMNHNAISVSDRYAGLGESLGKGAILSNPKPSIGRISAEIRKLIKSIMSRWGSVNPIAGDKAETLVSEVISQYKQELIPTKYVESILYYNHIPDKYLLETTTSNLSPSERLTLFERGKSVDVQSGGSQKGEDESDTPDSETKVPAPGTTRNLNRRNRTLKSKTKRSNKTPRRNKDNLNDSCCDDSYQNFQNFLAVITEQEWRAQEFMNKFNALLRKNSKTRKSGRTVNRHNRTIRHTPSSRTARHNKPQLVGTDSSSPPLDAEEDRSLSEDKDIPNNMNQKIHGLSSISPGAPDKETEK
jgi:hypothetical protein